MDERLSWEFWSIIDASYTQDELNALAWYCKQLCQFYL